MGGCNFSFENVLAVLINGINDKIVYSFFIHKYKSVRNDYAVFVVTDDIYIY